MIFIGADHRGIEMKAKINKWLKGRGFEFEDVGAFEYDHEDDFVDFAIDVAQKVADKGEGGRGILICGSGNGMVVAANKVRGIRCGLGFRPDQIHSSRRDDNINVMTLAADITEEIEGIKMVEMFLETEFTSSEKYLRRLNKIKRYERELAQS